MKAMKTNKEILTAYDEACNAVRDFIVDKHGFNGDDTFWVNNEPGGVLSCGDYFFGMDEMITDLREDPHEDELIKWYDYHTDCLSLGLDACNFRSWLHGCPRYSDEELERVRSAKDRIRDAERALVETVEEVKASLPGRRGNGTARNGQE